MIVSKKLGQSKQFNFSVAAVDKAKGIMKSKMTKLKNIPPEDYHLETRGADKMSEGQALTSLHQS